MRSIRYCNISLSIVLACTGAALAQNSSEVASTATPAPSVRAVIFQGNDRQPMRNSNLDRVGVQQSQTLPLTLNEAIRRTLENNNDIEVTRDDVRFQETQVRALLGVYDPVLTFSPLFTHSSSTGSTGKNDFRVNANMTGFIEKGGGNYQAFFNNTRTENAFTQAQVTSGSVSAGNSALYSSNLGVTYTQPLLRNFRVDSRRHSILIARKRLEQTESDFRRQANTTITSAARAYWDFVFALRNQQNQVANVNFSKENLRQIEARIAAGASAPIERAEIATELANREGDLLLATQQVASAENALKQLIIRDPLSPEWSLSVVPTDPPGVAVDVVTLDAALKDAMDNRFELRRLKLQQEINRADIDYYKNQTKPQIDLNTSFSLNGLAFGGTNAATTSNLVSSSSDIFLFNSLNATRTLLGLPVLTNPTVTTPASPGYLFGGFNRSILNMFRSDAPNYSIGATISFPLRNRTAKANLEGAQITAHQLDAQTRSQEQAVIVDVRNAVQALETARQRVDTARRARENAEIQLEGERTLFGAGKSTTFLLFQRENALTNARNAEVRAQTDYSKAIADLQRVTATTFRANNVEVVSPLPK
ncbi:MAG: TolC family protein [Acidobacteria bacterium]|nr:TolC family protein [Acidobacteriota bacterium]